jgi:hypothetical protein
MKKILILISILCLLKTNTHAQENLKEINEKLKQTEKNITDSLKKYIKNLPELTSIKQIEEIKNLQNENAELKLIRSSLENDKKQLQSSNSNELTKLKEDLKELTKENTIANNAKITAENEKNSIISRNNNEWESFTKSYLKSEKFISDELYNLLKTKISTNFQLKSELDIFQKNSVYLKAADGFIYEGKGDFKTVYSNLKNQIDNSNYSKQAQYQSDIQKIFDVIIFLSKELNDKLDVIKASNTESLRTDELKNWRYYKIGEKFPFIVDHIQKNYKKHTPFNFDPKNP